jgi:hypothetical protein
MQRAIRTALLSTIRNLSLYYYNQLLTESSLPGSEHAHPDGAPLAPVVHQLENSHLLTAQLCYVACRTARSHIWSLIVFHKQIVTPTLSINHTTRQSAKQNCRSSALIICRIRPSFFVQFASDFKIFGVVEFNFLNSVNHNTVKDILK